MCHHHSPSPASGEAFLAAVALLGLVALEWSGKVSTVGGLWFYAQSLMFIAVFYAVILLLRMIFFWATRGGEHMAHMDKVVEMKRMEVERKNK
jgi:uncharacterized membrane protein